MKAKSPIRFAGAHLRNKPLLALAIFWSVMFVIAPMQVPALTGALIDAVTGKPFELYGFVYSDVSAREALRLIVLGLTLVALLYGLSGYMRKTSLAAVSRGYVGGLTKGLIGKMGEMSLDIHGRFGAGELLSRATSDTEATRRFIESVFVKSATNAARVAYPLLMLILIDPTLTLLAVSVIPAQWIITEILQKKLRKASKSARVARSKFSTAVKQNLDAIETIKTSGAERYSLMNVVWRADEFESEELRANKYTAMITGSVWLSTSLGLALTWWQGGMMVLGAEMSLGTLVEFTGFAAFIYMPMRRFTNILSVYHKGVVALERIQEILEMDSSVRDSALARPLKITNSEIEFRDVSFTYGGRDTLKNISLGIRPRGITAIIGASGSGKSSLLKLIARLYDPSEGAVLMDGQDIKAVTLASLREKIAFVPQKPFIFSASVMENVRLAKPEATEREVAAACQAASALEFIMKLERGFNTTIGEGSVNLSGGEAQRIAIARALLRMPWILLLDEPTSALDPESSAAVMRTLNLIKHDTTVVIIAHDIATLRQADRLVLMDCGRVIAAGTHAELMSTSAYYRNIYFKENEGTTDERFRISS
ncbi:MAG: ABC transporter ATP-binding protein [Deltaproteobacteria bacterium]